MSSYDKIREWAGHHRQLFDNITVKLTTKETVQVAKLIAEYELIYIKNDDKHRYVIPGDIENVLTRLTEIRG